MKSRHAKKCAVGDARKTRMKETNVEKEGGVVGTTANQTVPNKARGAYSFAARVARNVVATSMNNCRKCICCFSNSSQTKKVGVTRPREAPGPIIIQLVTRLL